jgi:hypothetical protein
LEIAVVALRGMGVYTPGDEAGRVVGLKREDDEAASKEQDEVNRLDGCRVKRRKEGEGSD